LLSKDGSPPLFNNSAGIWTDENHPDMQDEAEIDQWLENLRQD